MTKAEHCPKVTIQLEPENQTIQIQRPKTVAQLLDYLGLAPETALVARNGKLLTHDRRIWPDDVILVRKVTSSG